jgi:arylsulfatase
MLGTRGIWHRGWKAVTEHGPMTDLGHFDKDRWQLFHTEVDRSEAHDLAAQHPERVAKLVALWMEEAAKNNVLPLSDLGVQGILKMEFKPPVPEGGQFVYYPGTSEIPEHSAANTHGVSFKVLADVGFTPKTKGVIFAHGSRFGGHSLFIKDGKLFYTYNFLGIGPEQKLIGDAPKSGEHVVGIEFTRERTGSYQESYGPARLYVDDRVVAESEIRTMTGHFAITGEGLCIGFDSGDPVSSEYDRDFEFSDGTLGRVVFDVADDAYVDVEAHLAAAIARD